MGKTIVSLRILTIFLQNAV